MSASAVETTPTPSFTTREVRKPGPVSEAVQAIRTALVDLDVALVTFAPLLQEEAEEGVALDGNRQAPTCELHGDLLDLLSDVKAITDSARSLTGRACL